MIELWTNQVTGWTEVWLKGDVGCCKGLKIGSGDTLAKAIENATNELEAAVGYLKYIPQEVTIHQDPTAYTTPDAPA